MSYVITFALDYTFHFYRMHEHVTVSHEKDSFNKHLSNYRFYSVKVDSSVKESSANSALKTEKTLILQA